ncbi:hypothetical protein RISK_006025 [Rhodopirellula islandica]|uniref:Uncharacterized protein n=1 Tax=Rhodopirellula islandica TaxID=595434 RepID=A0A0J1B5T4_RHOIS|nr:hypothetical protein RISK_006025 [Rhodopirellula islandica]
MKRRFGDCTNDGHASAAPYRLSKLLMEYVCQIERSGDGR